MRFLTVLVALLLLPVGAGAQSIFAGGLAKARAELEAKAALTDEERFLLGGVIVLETFETAFQTRWEFGMGRTSGMIPILRVPLPENPNPKTFDPAVVEAIFIDVLDGMEAARSHLEQVPAGSDFGAEVNLTEIWFDINGNGIEDPTETIFGLGRVAMGVRQTPESARVRFDRADVDWLIAYTHIFSAFGERVLAFEPEPIIKELLAAEAQIAEIHGAGIDYIGAFKLSSEWLSVAAIFRSIEQQPDRARTEAARQHFLAMVQANQRLWKAVALETDDAMEWVPNEQQTHALGLQFPEGLGPMWIGVLEEIEAVFEGELLLPYWRGGDGVGLNLKAIMQDPPEFNVVGWLHGIDAIPYLAKGEVANGRAWRDFERLVGPRNAFFFAVTLN